MSRAHSSQVMRTEEGASWNYACVAGNTEAAQLLPQAHQSYNTHVDKLKIL